MKPVAIVVFGLAILLNALANILVKASALKKDEETVEGFVRGFLLNPVLIAGLASFGLAFVAYRYVLSQGIPLSVAYPIMTTLGFAVVLVASRFFFDETLNLMQWGGIGFLVLGLWMVASQMVSSN